MSIGVILLIVVPSPNWPRVFTPQVNTLPLDVIAAEWLLPNEASIIFSPISKLNLEVISVGVNLLIFVPSPNCPRLFSH